MPSYNNEGYTEEISEKTETWLGRYDTLKLLSYSIYQLCNFFDVKALTTMFSSVSGSYRILKFPEFDGKVYVIIS